MRGRTMNLHEECLLKYLLNPFDLAYSTELLKMNNSLIEKNKSQSVFVANSRKANFVTNRI